MTITYGIQPTGVVTMAMKVLHNSYNMCLPDMYAHVITITCGYSDIVFYWKMILCLKLLKR